MQPTGRYENLTPLTVRYFGETGFPEIRMSVTVVARVSRTIPELVSEVRLRWLL
jgi:hypothetical protein